MGQGQSTGTEPQDGSLLKADFYDLLGVERSATDEEIKKAYRRKALELHPDRNYGNVEEATRLFAEVQSAYEVLSDPQERAWYDSHRDVLLRGGQEAGSGNDEFSYNIRMTTAEEVLKMMMRFNTRLEYTDGPKGFFGGLRDFFQRLAHEEDIACQWEDQPPLDYPDFGGKDDDYQDVVRPFYAAWNGFATKKSYAWKDKYKLSDAPDRRIRRLMEKENKKLREDGIREYNDAIRSLLAFARKRDPRFQENQKSEAERQKILREAAAAQAAKSRAAHQARLNELDEEAVPEWARSSAADEHEGGFSSESEMEEHEYECVVCNKTFKSEAQFQAHEKSKKHVKLLKQLQKELHQEDAEFEKEPTHQGDFSEMPQDSQHLVEPENTLDAAQSPIPVGAAHLDSDHDDLGDTVARPNDKPTIDSAYSSGDEDSTDDYAPRRAVEDRLAGEGIDSISNHLKSLGIEHDLQSSDVDSGSPRKIGKAKQKRARKAQQKTGEAASQADLGFKCAVCAAEFPSKTKLFNHIRDKGHAAPVSQVRAPKAKSGKAKKI